MKVADRCVVVLALALAAVYFYATEQIPTLQIGDPMGSKAIPRLLGVALLVSVGLLLLETRLARKRSEPAPSAEPPPGNRRHLVAIGAVVLWTALYFLVFERLGYAVATAVYLLALMAYFNPGRWLANGATALLFSLGSYALFKHVFGVQLAPGILPV